MYFVELEQAKGYISSARHCIAIIRNARRKDKLAFVAWIVFDRQSEVADAGARARYEDPTAMALK